MSAIRLRLQKQGKIRSFVAVNPSEHETNHDQRVGRKARTVAVDRVAGTGRRPEHPPRDAGTGFPAGGELGYRPNPVAVNLRSGRSNTVGVIVPEMVTPFAATVIGGIQRVLYGRGLKVIIAQSDENPQTECGNLELMERFMVDGVIACPCDATRNGEIYRRIRQRGVPLVFYDRAPLRVDASRVIVDDFATSYFLMEHLVRRGCRRIVHLGGPARISRMRGSVCAGSGMLWGSSGSCRTAGR